MSDPVPAALVKPVNAAVLAHVQSLSAHSDIVDLLSASLKPLGDVQLFCPDWQAYRYVVASTQGVVFALAAGMHTIAVRLDSRMAPRALQTGAEPYADCGDGWVAVLHRTPDDDWPAVDLPFWMRKAYVYARTL